MQGIADVEKAETQPQVARAGNHSFVKDITNPEVTNRQVHEGLPPLELDQRPLSFFEFWPSWLIYSPIAMYWLYQSLRHRSVSLPACANPDFYLGGMVGESKDETFEQAGSYARQFIAPYIKWIYQPELSAHQNALQAISQLQAAELSFPVIAKPDISCRGAGVRIIKKQQDLIEYLQSFPLNAAFLLQQLIPWEAEAGIFYVRHPDEEKGRILSVGLKYAPYVYGNGRDTLKTLILQDSRAGSIADRYYQRHQDKLESVLPEGQPFRLAFTGSHSRGAIFRDGNNLITAALEAEVDRICRDIKGFHIGRLDIRFQNTQLLMQGKDFRILEINGISGEATHIWDARSTLGELYRTLFKQYGLLFEYGAANRKKGASPPGLMEILRGWWREKSLTSRYPYSD
ncbi:D-alanine--D-alanine ligase [Endozoicomonadaceae bacterium StTr2]